MIGALGSVIRHPGRGWSRAAVRRGVAVVSCAALLGSAGLFAGTISPTREAREIEVPLTVRKFALKGNRPAPPYWIMDAEKEPIDNAKYKAGDEVPGIIVAPFSGDRGDVAVRWTYKEGVRTLEIARKLVTGSEFDVQFNDLKKQYAFGVSVFDNAQVRHAYSPGVLKLVFE